MKQANLKILLFLAIFALIFFPNIVSAETTWSNPELITAISGIGWEGTPSKGCGAPDIAIDSQGNWHMVWLEGEGILAPSEFTNITLRYQNSAMSEPVTIVTSSLLSSSPSRISSPSIALDSQGKVHIAYLFSDSQWYSSIMYLNNVSGGWSNPQAIITVSSDYNSPTPVYRYCREPDIAVDSQDNWHIAWWQYESVDSPSGYTQSSEIKYQNSAMSEPVAIVTSSLLSSSNPSVAIDSQDKVHIAYRQWEDFSPDYPQYHYDSSIRYVNNLSGSWSIPQPIVTISSSGDYTSPAHIVRFCDAPDITIDSQDNWHIVWCQSERVDSPNPSATIEIKYQNSKITEPASIYVVHADVPFYAAVPLMVSFYTSASITADSQDNAHIAYQSWNGFYNSDSQYIHEYSIMYTHSQSRLALFDGSDFSVGREVNKEPQKIISILNTADPKPVEMEGVVTDGVSRLLLKMEVNDINPVTFSIEGESNNPEQENGFLHSLDNQEDTQQKNQSLTVLPTQVDNKKYVFAIYRAPENFVRQGIDKDIDGKDDDTIISERSITLKVESNNETLATKEIKLVRPPVVLVHGLWSSPKEAWGKTGILENLFSAFGNIKILCANYKPTNAASFYENRRVVPESISEIKKRLKDSKIAVTQVDVIGHSMGGLLARIWAGRGKKVYLRDDNFEAGDINSLITIDTPHQGAFLADAAMERLTNLPNLMRLWLIAQFEKAKKSLTGGAISDLTTTSLNIQNLQKINISHTPRFSIAGDFVVPMGDVNMVKFYSVDLWKVHGLLITIGHDTKPYIIDSRSDLVVSLWSQLYGPWQQIFGNHHNDIGTNEIFNALIDILN